MIQDLWYKNAIIYQLDIQLKGPKEGKGTKDYEHLQDLRQFLAWRAQGAIVLGEANVTLNELREYFGSGERMQMLLNFMANQHMFNSLAHENAAPLIFPPAERERQEGKAV